MVWQSETVNAILGTRATQEDMQPDTYQESATSAAVSASASTSKVINV